MSWKYLLPACGLLLASCKSPAERAELAARAMLAHQLAPTAGLVPGPLRVYPFSTRDVHYFTADLPGFTDGHLVVYECRPAGPAGPAQKFATFVADNDSAFFFTPFQHADEFRQRYGAGATPPPVKGIKI